MTLSEQLQERQADKDNALAEIAVVLDRLETEARNPDAWERGFLVHALSAQFAGLYRFATMDARLALATPAEHAATPACRSIRPLSNAIWFTCKRLSRPPARRQCDFIPCLVRSC